MSRNGASAPRVAILGAGPVGIEAALACAGRGLPFTVYEAADSVGGNVRSWGQVRLFTPWRMNVSDRMRRHLAPAKIDLDPEECPTGHELVARLLGPLSRLRALGERVRLGTEVVAVSREGLLKNHEIGTGRRAERPFRLLLRARGGAAPFGEGRRTSGREWTETAHVVLDCTGTVHHPNAVGDGGIPAPGEEALAHRITRRIPDLEAERSEWGGRTTLLVGAGHSAQTAARDLAELAEGHPGTRVLWAVRRAEPEWGEVPDDPLALRAELGREARRLANGASPVVEVLPGRVVDRFYPPEGSGAEGERVRAVLRSHDGSRDELEVDRVLALTGSVGDHRIYRQLQVHECYATSGPMKLAAALLGSASGDCLAQESHGPETLANPEPGFFLLGSKSYGRNNTFLMRTGWSQVEEVFQLLDS